MATGIVLVDRQSSDGKRRQEEARRNAETLEWTEEANIPEVILISEMKKWIPRLKKQSLFCVVCVCTFQKDSSVRLDSNRLLTLLRRKSSTPRWLYNRTFCRLGLSNFAFSRRTFHGVSGNGCYQRFVELATSLLYSKLSLRVGVMTLCLSIGSHDQCV